jgi:general secretion pathway protein A
MASESWPEGIIPTKTRLRQPRSGRNSLPEPGIRHNSRFACCRELRYQGRVYLDFYGLREMPFDLAPNPRFLFFSPRHREAFNHLLYGLRERKGFVQLTGEVGCGKTTLCRALLRELGSEFATALILNPWLGPDDLLPAVAEEFGVGLGPGGGTPLAALARLNHFLLDQQLAGREVVLLIDEAQDLSVQHLEQVRLLSNLETDERKLLQIVLLGQPELRRRLREHRLRQLRQRITVRYHLGPLLLGELEPYIRYRLSAAGGQGRPSFTRPALLRIQLYSGGVPRLVNALCDKCLLAGFVARNDRIDYTTVARAVRELEGQFTR